MVFGLTTWELIWVTPYLTSMFPLFHECVWQWLKWIVQYLYVVDAYYSVKVLVDITRVLSWLNIVKHSFHVCIVQYYYTAPPILDMVVVYVGNKYNI